MQSVHAGLSIAVIHDYKIAWAKGFGVTAPGGSEPVTTTTLFQAGSISKSVATIGALGLVEHGKLSLDQDVNQKLKTWKVPENELVPALPLGYMIVPKSLINVLVRARQPIDKQKRKNGGDAETNAA